ncbi:hypothetical protein ACFYXS_31955 [Streptomyces sp. NPDC002574]|uniref:hypothetical protein n=1 Tax=Streptomyces sp. NPDC002574 TaxID=3364652 RepID=UPI00367E0100
MALEDPNARPSAAEPPPAGAEGADPPRGADASLLTGDQLLPCGRPLSRAWELARDATSTTDPHTAACPYCRQAVEGLAALDEAIDALCAQERPSAQAIADRVIRTVRAEIRLGRMLPLDDPAGDLRIAETAAAKVLRRAADTVIGAQIASLRMTPSGEGPAVHIALTLAATPDRPLPEYAARVRQAVLHAAHRTLGLAISGVDVTITDLLEPDVPTARGEADLPEGEFR